MEPIIINRSITRNRFGASFLYAVHVPGAEYPNTGGGLNWARNLAKSKAAPGQQVIENWEHDGRSALRILNDAAGANFARLTPAELAL